MMSLLRSAFAVSALAEIGLTQSTSSSLLLIQVDKRLDPTTGDAIALVADAAQADDAEGNGTKNNTKATSEVSQQGSAEEGGDNDTTFAISVHDSTDAVNVYERSHVSGPSSTALLKAYGFALCFMVLIVTAMFYKMGMTVVFQ